MDAYPDLIASPPDGAPPEHPQVRWQRRPVLGTAMPAARGSLCAPRQFRVQRSFLGVVYLKHLQSWKLVRTFIRAGGLSALVRLFTCPAMVVRAQATEAFGLVRHGLLLRAGEGVPAPPARASRGSTVPSPPRTARSPTTLASTG